MLIRFFARSNILAKQFRCPFSTISQLSRTVSTSVKKQEMNSFQEVLPRTLDALSKSEKFKELPDIGEWIKKLIAINVDGGKKKRGLATVYAYEMLEDPAKITEESVQLARIAGWCVEMMQAYFLILDDIMDSSLTRRGVPCWYKNSDVGLRAINDALLIKCSFNEILKIYFKDKPYYSNLVEVMNDTLYYTSIGQHLDNVTATTNKDYSQYTIDRVKAIAKYKSAYYTIHLPVAIGLLMTNNTDRQILKQIEDICVQIGCYFQVQDDYIDVYGDPEITGKQGTDIVEGKCSWLAVTALQYCSPSQRNLFNECYGSKESIHHEKIMQLYEELGVKQLYKEYENSEYKKIKDNIEKLPPNLSQELFIKLIDSLHFRTF